MMGSSPVANPVCWGSIIAIPLNLTIPRRAAGHLKGRNGVEDPQSGLTRRTTGWFCSAIDGRRRARTHRRARDLGGGRLTLSGVTGVDEFRWGVPEG